MKVKTNLSYFTVKSDGNHVTTLVIKMDLTEIRIFFFFLTYPTCNISIFFPSLFQQTLVI